MTVQILDSGAARARWRDIMDSARAGQDTVIEHYNRPTAAVIPYADFLALQEELEDLRAARRAALALAAWEQAPSSGTPLGQVEAELRAEGLLDA